MIWWENPTTLLMMWLHTYNLVSFHTLMILWEGTHTYYLVEQSHHINAGVTEPWWEKPTHGHDKQ